MPIEIFGGGTGGISFPVILTVTMGIEGDATAPSTVRVGETLVVELRNLGPMKGVYGVSTLPGEIDLATVNPLITVRFITSGTGVAGNVILRATMRYVANGELITKAADETFTNTVAVINTLGAIHTTTYTLTRALLSIGDLAHMHMERLNADAGDTFTGDIGIIMFGEIAYEIS